MTFATKPAQALRMLGRTIDGGLPARWVTADEAYGKDVKFRAWLQRRRIGYVLAVACNQRIPTQGRVGARRRAGGQSTAVGVEAT